MNISLQHDGKTYRNFSEEGLKAEGIPQDVIDAAKAKADGLAQRDKVRATIAANVGDAESILGTVADASGVLVALSLARISALASTKAADLSVAEKAELATVQTLAGDVDLAVVAAEALGKISAGEAVLTASVKGLDAVIGESLERSTAVSNIMVQSSEG